ncbi:hypothetical protein CYMTET_6032 [Cymbomonas tetramitiformis]|uniref:Uncharacterized protein n=1 Tax=Cymbomonas tetramitiformis TaxID=36881 RepID=A0AAE0GZY1_9CHLO|nr:hypothetical protein CYMTET_6032 [Cymbomonas tetramitiformis]
MARACSTNACTTRLSAPLWVSTRTRRKACPAERISQVGSMRTTRTTVLKLYVQQAFVKRKGVSYISATPFPRFKSSPLAATVGDDQFEDPLEKLEQLEALLSSTEVDTICGSDGASWKTDAIEIAKGAQQAATEACNLGGTVNVVQLRFELVRYTQLLAMDLKMLQAARTPETVASRISQASSRCQQAIQLARATGLGGSD